MPVVEIITESSRTGRFRRILDGVLPYIRSNRCFEVLLLVPSNLMVEEIREELLQQESVQGFFGLTITTFLDLAGDVFQESDLPGRIGSPQGRQWRLQSILSALSPGRFGEIRQTRGMLALTADFIRTLKEGGISPGEFESAPPVGQEAHLRELGRIYREYEERRKRQGILDREDLIHLAAEKIRKTPGGFLRSLREIIVTGFYDFTPLQLRLLSAFTTLADLEKLTISLEAPLSSSVIERSLKGLQHFLPGAKIVSPAEEPVEPETALRYLQRELAVPTTRKKPVGLPEEDESIELLQSPGTYREVEEIARKIREFHKDRNLSFREMAVVFRNFADYRETVREIFRSFRIPHQLTSGLPLRSNPLTGTVTALLECPRSRYRRDAVIRLLTSSCLRFDPLEKSGLTPERIDTLAREAMIEGGKEEWRARLRSRLEVLNARERFLTKGDGENRDREEQEERISRCRVKIAEYRKCIEIMEAFFTLFDDLPREATVPEFVDRTEQLCRAFHLEEEIFRIPDRRLIRRDQAAFRELEELFSELSREHGTAGKRGKIPLADFAGLLSLTFSEKNYRPDPPREDAVLVTDALGIRGIRRPVVLIGGLVEGNFPRNPLPNPLFGETDRSRVNAHFAPDRWVPRAAHRLEEEELLFYFAVAAATRFLILSSPRTDGEGRTLLPSRYLDTLGTLFPEGRLRVTSTSLNDPLPEERRIFRPRELTDYTFRALSRPVPEEPGFPSLLKLLLRERRETCRAVCHGLAVLKAREEGDGSYLGLLGSTAADGIQREEGNYSVTALEKYGACPFRYFCERELKLRPLEEVEEEMGALDLGSLYHRILERFYRETAGPVTTSGLAGARKRMDRIIEAEIVRMEKRGIPGHGKIWEIRQEEIRQVLDRFLDDELKAFEAGGEVPTHFEVSFGMERTPRSDPLSSPDPLILPSESGEIRIEGKIDRIDLKDGEAPSFSILDYKTGQGVPPGKVAIEKGDALQLPLYAAWAQETFGKSRELRQAAFVLLRKGKRKGQINAGKEKDWEELKAISQAYVRNYVQKIRQGHFPLGEKDCPTYCHYGEICRKEEK